MKGSLFAYAATHLAAAVGRVIEQVEGAVLRLLNLLQLPLRPAQQQVWGYSLCSTLSPRGACKTTPWPLTSEQQHTGML